MRIRDILDPRRIQLAISSGSKKEILTELASSVADTHRSIDLNRLVEVLLKREETSTTAIADGIAIPHGKMVLGEEVICAFGRSPEGVDFKSVDGKPTHLFFLLVSPESHPSLHLRWLAHIAALLNNPELRRALVNAETPQELLAALSAEEAARDAMRASDEK
jgi:mannitol/fructose-specific phosphotransferase system IIA component (Ntr-type)